jgi:signal transduction histidine kinase
MALKSASFRPLNWRAFQHYRSKATLRSRPLCRVADTSRLTATVAVRILNGEKAGDIKVSPVEFSAPRFDWGQMQRWGISEKNLPPGGEILFRDPTVWEQYRAYILAVAAAILIQAALIFWLLYEHWRRQRAEIVARNTMSELGHVNRMATVGQLSASIAHEVNQPLAGIVANAQAALRWLEKANVDEVRDVAQLFKPMFTTKARGMGMGLSICQSIIENHDGRIWVSPGATGGSIFQFELPTIGSAVAPPIDLAKSSCGP